MYYLEGDENRTVIPKVSLIDGVLGVKKDDDELAKNFRSVSFKFTGLAAPFSRLKTDEQILNFANEHGFLGVKLEDSIDIPQGTQLINFKYGHEFFETTKLWRWHIDHVKRLLKLYNTLKNKGDLEELLYVENYKSPYSKETNKMVDQLYAARYGEPRKEDPAYNVFWYDGRPATLIEKDEPEIRSVALKLLFSDILHMVMEGVYSDYGHVKINPDAAFGFSFKERKATKYLLCAIYNDLWRTINNAIEVKECPICTDYFTPKRSDAEFCGDTCRKRNERKEKKSLGV